MKTVTPLDCEVLVVGAGISGLGAAWELQKAGVKVKVLEAADFLGGRMNTTHVDGFAIDRGVTIFGGGFREMRRLLKETGLQKEAEFFRFQFALKDGPRTIRMGRTNLREVLFTRKLKLRSKIAAAWFAASVLANRRHLAHGDSAQALKLDDMSTEEYFRRIGGTEFFEKILLPALNGPLGGGIRQQSRLIVFQVFWNILLRSTWAIRGGVGRLADAMAAQLDLELGCRVQHIEMGHPCQIQGLKNGEPHTWTTERVVLAIPGELVPAICPGLPEDVKNILNRAQHATMTSAHVQLGKVPDDKVTALTLESGTWTEFELEVEHNRASRMCPPGKGMVSLYMWDDSERQYSQLSDEAIAAQAHGAVAEIWPECAAHLEGTTIFHWPQGIAQFPAGRLAEMSQLRHRMQQWVFPIQLCGDYLDGISSEGALRTGVEAAENVLGMMGLSRHPRPVSKTTLSTNSGNPCDWLKAASHGLAAIVHCQTLRRL